MHKNRLFTPGPTPVPERVNARMIEPILHHRHPEFIGIFRTVNEDLKYLFQTALPVLTLTSSGTGGMEACVVNLLSAGDEVITVEGGKFAERWTLLCTRYGVRSLPLPVEWGRSVQPDEIRNRLTKKTKAVFLTHSETSTGASTDIQSVARIIHEHSNALVVVDGITAVGAHQLQFDEWGIDACVTGSQKGLMIPPGLAFVALSERAWKAAEVSDLPKFYFSFSEARKALADQSTPWTPAISLITGLGEALKMIRQEGMNNIWNRHQLLGDAARAGVSALGLKLFAEHPSNAVTAVLHGSGIQADSFTKLFKSNYGITIAGGQDRLKGKIFRISHLGFYDRFDMISVISALELVLSELNYRFEPGSAVSAVQKVFDRWIRERKEQ